MEFLAKLRFNDVFGKCSPIDKSIASGITNFKKHVVFGTITPCVFFLLGFLKPNVYVVPLPLNLDGLKTSMCNTMNLITPDMLKRI